MPIYEYRCEKCGDFEVTQKITDKSLTRCLTCRGKVKKLISNTSFQLKGSGWYITDYARKGKDGKEKKEEKPASPESKSDGKASSSSDTAQKSSTEKSSTEKSSAKTSTSESASA